MTIRTRGAVVLGLMLGACGCTSSLISCSSSLMSCSSALLSGDDEDGRPDQRATPVALLRARAYAPIESEDLERSRPEQRPFYQSPEAPPARSVVRGSEVDAAVTNPASKESIQGALVRLALSYVGAPYRWGGLTPAGFDCSGFVKYLHARVGISIPHNAAAQYRYGAPVSRDRLKPGDLVFFDHLRHNGIYIGRGQFIHASKTGDGVKISNLDEPWYRDRWVGGRRLAGEV